MVIYYVVSSFSKIPALCIISMIQCKPAKLVEIHHKNLKQKILKMRICLKCVLLLQDILYR